MSSPIDEQVRFSDYVVAYFDVQGQKEKLNQLREMPTTEEETKRFENMARQTYLAVKYLRKGLQDSLELYRRMSCAYIDSIPHISENQRKQQRNMVESKYQFSFFSDSYAVTARYYNDNGEPLIQHIFGLLINLSCLMLKSFSNHTPIRGAIELGKGFEWPEGGVYGPVMGDVYHLESQIAWYPRIIIGCELKKCICDWTKKTGENNNYYVSYKPVIAACEAMIYTDKDGVATLDYMSQEVYNLVKPIPQMKEYAKLGFDFVNSEYNRFKDCQNSQMALRYSLLKEYFSSRLNIWE